MALQPRTIVRISLFAVRAAERTVWLLCEAEDARGGRGLGEATLAGCELEVAAHFSARAASLVRCGSGPIFTDYPASLAESAACSGIGQAIVDLEARREGVSVAALLGLGEPRSVSVYANINRGTATRTPEGFARRALEAVADGFTAIKIAPFDPLPPDSLDQALRGGALPNGFAAAAARMRAVRKAIGSEVELLVDCHWRLDAEGAAKLGDEARELGIAWIESPIPESEANAERLKDLRAHYGACGIELAGGELLFATDQFEDWSRRGVLDVLMPDVKYLPTLDLYLRVLAAIRRCGREPSPHNPTGPVCHAFTWQISVATPFVQRMEMQYRETGLFCDLVGVPRDFADSRWNAGMPVAAGIGFDLQPSIVQRHLIGAITVGQKGSSGEGIFARLALQDTARASTAAASSKSATKP
jgi:galactonate dehydratase